MGSLTCPKQSHHSGRILSIHLDLLTNEARSQTVKIGCSASVLGEQGVLIKHWCNKQKSNEVALSEDILLTKHIMCVCVWSHHLFLLFLQRCSVPGDLSLSATQLLRLLFDYVWRQREALQRKDWLKLCKNANSKTPTWWIKSNFQLHHFYFDRNRTSKYLALSKCTTFAHSFSL